MIRRTVMDLYNSIDIWFISREREISIKRVLEVAMSVLVRCVLLLSMLTLTRANTHVFIMNGLEGKEDLHIYYKSKDDDLGPHVLRINQTFKITFWA